MTDTENKQIVLTNVSKRYTSSPVLESIDLAVDNGEFLVFVGRSGSGKSTLLRLIGGLENPDSGTVVHGGRDIARMNETELSKFRRRSLGFVFQFFNLIPTLNVIENVSLPLALNDHKDSSARDKVSGLLEELGLEQCASRFPDELSGGEQQRAAIARARHRRRANRQSRYRDGLERPRDSRRELPQTEHDADHGDAQR